MPANEVKLLVWPVGDRLTASTRQRLLKLIPYLEEDGIRVSLVHGGKTHPWTAFRALLRAPRSDCVLIQKKLLPPSYLAFLRRLSKRLIYDFDDALYAARSNPRPDQVELAVGQKARLDRTLREVDLVVAGNEELAMYARRHAPRVTVIPTGVDVRTTPTKTHAAANQTIIGWIGSEGTMSYLEEVSPVIQELSRRYGGRISLRVVSNARFEPPGIVGQIDNVAWSLESEIEDILSFDIGIMPLRDDAWSRGKCAFKALQMMVLGIPVVASPVGANRDVLRDGMNGYLAEHTDEWVAKIARLIDSPALRARIGRNGKKTILGKYSVEGAGHALSAAIRDLCMAGAIPSRD